VSFYFGIQVDGLHNLQQLDIDHLSARISNSQKGWMDQELGTLWLQQDFKPATQEHMQANGSDGYHLLILDGHNSHCTYKFIKHANDHKIIILCLPSHTTHKLQPCDVGIFGPLAAAWKKEVTLAGCKNITISKHNMLFYYDKARTSAFKSSTIRSAFLKTGIHPLNCNIIPAAVYALSINTTMQSAQPLPASLPDILMLAVIRPSKIISAMSSISQVNADHPTNYAGNISTDALASSTTGSSADLSSIAVLTADSNAAYTIFPHNAIRVPDPLSHIALHSAQWVQHNQLCQLIAAALLQLERDHMQMVLMDCKNGHLCKIAFAKKAKPARKEATGHSCILTADKN
jgi:hypothetical protein